MEAGIMEDLRICREERDILKQKLHIHLDRWTLDKIMLKEKAANAAMGLRLKEAEQSYEIARRDMRIGSQQQQLLVLQLKLDSAMEDIELKDIQFSALKSQLQEERRWLHYADRQLEKTKASWSNKLASKRSKFVLEMEKKIHYLQKALEDRARSHMAETEQIEGKHALALTHLKEEIKQLITRDDDAKAKQSEWTLERKQLQELLAQERDNLTAGQEKLHKGNAELRAVLQERENLRGELEKWKSQQKEMQAVMDEKDRLIAEKACFVLREQEMVDLLTDRDRLNAQQEHCISREDDIQELSKERDKLKCQLDQSEAQRQLEVTGLVREIDFVWSQMKRLDDDYAKQIKKMSEKNLQDRQEIEKLNNELKGVEVGHNEIMVEMTILKLEAKRVEDLAIQKKCAFEAELQELHSRLEKVEKEKRTLIADAMKKHPRLLALTSRIEDLDRQLDQDQGVGTVADDVKDGAEVLNSRDGPTLDQEIPESQIEQATQVQRSHGIISAKSVDDLTRENENLRLENENLRILYAEAEDALRKKQQKPAKVINKANHRDPTSRNLKLELEAAATRSPPDEKPITDGNGAGKGKKKSLCKQKGVSSPNSSQKKRDSSSKSDREGGHSSENAEVSKRITRSSKGILLPSRKYSSDEVPEARNVIIMSPKNLRRRSRVDYSELDIAVDQNEIKPVKKKGKNVDNGDIESIQNPRPALQPLPHNQRSSAKSAVRTSSSSRGPLPESGKKTFIGSPTKTSKMMTNLFSTAFSVPKLKNVQTPSNFMT